MFRRTRRAGAHLAAATNCSRLQLEPLEDRRLLSADAVLDWNAIALDAVKRDYVAGHTSHDQGGPTRDSRALAIVHVAMYDAVTAIDRTFMPYLVDVRAARGTSMNAAVAQAAHDTLVALWPHQKNTFDTALANSLVGIPKTSATLGKQLGHQVAERILALRAHDGSSDPMHYTPGTLPGEYRADPLHPDQMALGPDWGGVKPFVISSADQFPAPPVPGLSSQAYTDAYNEVKLLGGDGTTTSTTRTAEQTQIGIFWGYDGTPGLGTPPRLYNQITRVIAQQRGNNEVQNARLFALVNVAMADAGITAWDTKFADNFWRPITAIRESDPGTGPSGLGDGNPNTVGDPSWTPLGAPNDNGGGTNFTPPFPAYTSGHAAFGAATFGSIRNFYHTDNISFSFTSDEFNGITRDSAGNVRPVVTRSYSSLSQAVEENGQSRIYLGIHWKFDKVQGIAQGTSVANFVAKHFGIPTPSQRPYMASGHHGSAALPAVTIASPTTAVAAPVATALAVPSAVSPLNNTPPSATSALLVKSATPPAKTTPSSSALDRLIHTLAIAQAQKATAKVPNARGFLSSGRGH